MPKPLLVALVVLVATAWAVNLTVGYLHLADTEPSVNAVFMLILGSLFPVVRRKFKGSKGSKDDGDDAS